MVIPLALVLLAGCSSSNPSPAVSAAAPSSAPTSAPASLTPSAGATPAKSTTPSAALPSAPATSAASSASAFATGPSATSPADLRLLLPSSIDGHTLAKTQFNGTTIAGQPGGGISTELSDTLTHFGKKISDLTVAFATDPTQKVDLSITAIRVAGVSGADFLAAYAPELQKAFPEATIAQQTVAGKVVDAVTTAPNVPPQFLVAHNDVVFLVNSTDPTLAVAAVAGLP